MIRPESLEMPALHCSLDRTLGHYYQDFSPAIQLVEEGYHGGIDSSGVPWVRRDGRSYDAIITAQYALANMIACKRGEQGRREVARRQLDWLVATQEREGEWAGCWLMAHDNAKYPWLRAPWTSSMASGNAMSALLRGWQLFGDDRYRQAARSAYHALHLAGRRRRLTDDRDGELWYEEYPAEPPLRVLNGHVYTLLGVLDYARAFGDEEAHARWRRAALTALAHLEDFDLGYWSAYELRWREPAAVHYQKNIHVPQLRILAQLTGEAGFTVVADRWEGYLSSPVARWRWAAAIRLHRWRPKR